MKYSVVASTTRIAATTRLNGVSVTKHVEVYAHWSCSEVVVCIRHVVVIGTIQMKLTAHAEIFFKNLWGIMKPLNTSPVMRFFLAVLLQHLLSLKSRRNIIA
jgi:hypothetical protein